MIRNLIEMTHWLPSLFRYRGAAWWFAGTLTLQAHFLSAADSVEGHATQPATVERPLPAIAEKSSSTPVEEKTPVPGRPAGLDSAFDFGPEFGGARDFLLDEGRQPAPGDSEWKQRIEMARQQRQSGEHDFAFANLQAVLDGSASEDMKKTALLELATTHYAARQFHEALKTYGIFRKRYPQDAGLPHVLLSQGLLLRDLGAPQAALGKFHSVLSATLNLNLDEFEYYRKLVLLAQSQIAETLYSQGKLEEAGEKYIVLLRDDSRHLNRARIRYQLIQCLEGQGRHADLVTQARSFLDSDLPENQDPQVVALMPHVRYLLSSSLKQLGRASEALAEVKALLEEAVGHDSPGWNAWKQRTGNEIANQLYQDGDYFNALNLYLRLTELDDSPTWQLPVWYQIGLIHERLDSPPEAVKAYQKILDRESEVTADSGPALATLIHMARWRSDFIQWKFEADKARIQLQRLPEADSRTASKQ